MDAAHHAYESKMGKRAVTAITSTCSTSYASINPPLQTEMSMQAQAHILLQQSWGMPQTLSATLETIPPPC